MTFQRIHHVRFILSWSQWEWTVSLLTLAELISEAQSYWAEVIFSLMPFIGSVHTGNRPISAFFFGYEFHQQVKLCFLVLPRNHAITFKFTAWIRQIKYPVHPSTRYTKYTEQIRNEFGYLSVCVLPDSIADHIELREVNSYLMEHLITNNSN